MSALIMTYIKYTEKKVFFTLIGIKPGPSQNGAICINHLTKALCILFVIIRMYLLLFVCIRYEQIITNE